MLNLVEIKSFTLICCFCLVYPLFTCEIFLLFYISILSEGINKSNVIYEKMEIVPRCALFGKHKA